MKVAPLIIVEPAQVKVVLKCSAEDGFWCLWNTGKGRDWQEQSGAKLGLYRTKSTPFSRVQTRLCQFSFVLAITLQC